MKYVCLVHYHYLSFHYLIFKYQIDHYHLHNQNLNLIITQKIKIKISNLYLAIYLFQENNDHHSQNIKCYYLLNNSFIYYNTDMLGSLKKLDFSYFNSFYN